MPAPQAAQDRSNEFLPGPTLALVVPCFNEESRLDPVAFLDALADRPDTVLIMVNDGSTDRTSTMLEILAQSAPERIQVLHLPDNRGKAEAVRQGILRALDHRVDLVGYWDADLATPLSAIADFVTLFSSDPRLEVVMAARVKLLGRIIERHAWRQYLGRVFATLVSLYTRLPVYDTQCGAKIFRARDELRRVFAEPFVTPWLFDVEILIRLMSTRGGREWVLGSVAELPLREWRDKGGSKLTGIVYLRAAASLVRLMLAYRREVVKL